MPVVAARRSREFAFVAHDETALAAGGQSFLSP